MTKLHNRGGKREGAGRPKGTTKAEGLATRMMRVSTQISKEHVDAIPELIDLLNHYEEECLANPEVRTYDKLRKFLDEARALGF